MTWSIFVEPGSGQGDGPIGSGPVITPGGNTGGPIFDPPPLGAGPVPVRPIRGILATPAGGIAPVGTGDNPAAPPVFAPVAAAVDWLNTAGPLGLTYGQIGLIGLGLLVLIGGSKK